MKPHGCANYPAITFNPERPSEPSVWLPGAGYCVISGPTDPRCEVCRWRGIGRVPFPDAAVEKKQRSGEDEQGDGAGREWWEIGERVEDEV